ncbi:hypothetical protein JOF56_004459 [Kibdelosporangium banguiense]|uniref:HEAT repeat domain-containing protein n=1 Tax=Kibdelosporangium banguiense TaxID=1365924 RepID=A0ABS4TIE3_9PSEU|nr:hypothetical protein [Kibdelosporangium banguiense]MBP2324074.1 hypothetical protein [Kibdelosporangium banguiense]
MTSSQGFSTRTLNRIIDTLAANHSSSRFESARFFQVSQLPMFLIDLWETRGKDADSLLAQLVRMSPDHSWQLVRRLWAAGVPIGPKATAELATVTDGAVMDLHHQWGTIRTLRDLMHPEGVARLLGMAVDADLTDDLRIAAIAEASGSSPAAAAAMGFLMKRNDFPDWEFPDSDADAIDAIPDADDEILEGFLLIVQNRHLAEGTRANAAALAVISGGESVYQELVRQQFSASLIALLGEEAARGTTEARSVLWRMVTDTHLASSQRFEAAYELDLLGGDSEASAFRVLAKDPDFDERYRRRAVAALADPSV